MYEVIDLFPTPVYKSSVSLANANEVTQFLVKQSFHKQHGGNLGTDNTSVLEFDIMTDLRSQIQSHLDTFFNGVLNYKNKIYITNSWVNINPIGTSHSYHNHANSIISGVVYLNIPTDSPDIVFTRNNNEMLLIHPEQYNEYNSPSYNCQVGEFDILLFPSSLHHHVMENKGNDFRVSLAFNTFIRGEIGSIDQSTYLNLG